MAWLKLPTEHLLLPSTPLIISSARQDYSIGMRLITLTAEQSPKQSSPWAKQYMPHRYSIAEIGGQLWSLIMLHIQSISTISGKQALLSMEGRITPMMPPAGSPPWPSPKTNFLLYYNQLKKQKSTSWMTQSSTVTYLVKPGQEWFWTLM